MRQLGLAPGRHAYPYEDEEPRHHDTASRARTRHVRRRHRATPTARSLPHAQVIRNVVDEAVLADELGVDFFGVGEHHRADFAVSAPEVVLAAIAGRTERIRLGSAVTVLSSDDPGARLPALRDARRGVERAGRGDPRAAARSPSRSRCSATTSTQYEMLFEEKLDLFAALLEARSPVTWQRHDARRRSPTSACSRPTETGTLTTWIGVGGSPESVVRAARYGMPLMLAIIGGDPQRFAPYVDLYHRALDAARQADAADRRAFARPHRRHRRAGRARSSGPHYKAMRDRIGAERGWGPMSRAEFDQEAEPTARCTSARPRPSPARSPRPRARSGISRFDLKYSAGAAAARQADAQHRALRPQGHPARARHARLSATPSSASAER